jgi:tRNA A-37 threonylcarbamoyl transferase component Bud32
MIGQSIGNYRVTQLLGEGGMGMVYLAEHPTLGRRAAVKVLHPDLVATHEMIQRLFNEARAANAVGHPGIVEVSDLGLLPSGTPYIVMEYLEGQSLGARIAATGRLSLRAALDIADQAASALGAAHAKGIIHRDLKPDNLFLTPDPLAPGRERLKVLDFGIAKLARRPSSAADVRTRTGAILGTPRYMSPEQCRDSREVDHRSDIYSLGVILYEMLSGAPPFVSASWGEMAHMHLGVKPPDLGASVPELPPALERAVSRALEKEPDARFQSMEELRQALADSLAGQTTLAAPIFPAAVPAAASEVPSTLRLDAAGATRPIRRTTLGGTASEIQRAPGTTEARRHGRRLGIVIAAGVLGSAIVVIGALATRPGADPEARESATSTPPAAAVPAPTAVPAPVVRQPEAAPPPAPGVVEPEATAAAPVKEPIQESVKKLAKPAPAPVRRRPAAKPRQAPAAGVTVEPQKV